MAINPGIDYASLLFPSVGQDENGNPIRKDEEIRQKYLNGLSILPFVEQEIFDEISTAKEKEKEQRSRIFDESKKAQEKFEEASDLRLLATEDEIKRRGYNNFQGGPFLNTYTGRYEWGQQAFDEALYVSGRNRDSLKGILAPERHSQSAVANRMLAKGLVSEGFFDQVRDKHIFLTPEERKQAEKELESFAQYGKDGAFANWSQYGWNPTTWGVTAALNLYENYFGKDPLDVAESAPVAKNWNPQKAWELYSDYHPEISSWLLQSGFNPDTLRSTRDDFNFFERIGDHIDQVNLRRTAEVDLKYMGDISKTLNTTLIPLVRDSFASADAPFDMAATAGLTVLSGGTATGAFIAMRMAPVGSRAYKTAKAAATLAMHTQRWSNKTMSWLPHNIPAKYLFTPGASTASKLGYFTASSVATGVVTGALYNVANQVNRLNSESDYQFSAENLGHDIVMEIVGELGLGGGIGAVGRSGSFIVSKVNELTHEKAGKLAKSVIDTLPSSVKDSLALSARLLNPDQAWDDMTGLEAQQHLDSVLAFSSLMKIKLLSKDTKTFPTLSAALWGLGVKSLSPEYTVGVIEEARKKFDEKKKTDNTLTDLDYDIYVANHLLSALYSRGIDVKPQFEVLWEKILRESFLTDVLNIDPEASEQVVEEAINSAVNLEKFQEYKTKITERTKTLLADLPLVESRNTSSDVVTDEELKEGLSGISEESRAEIVDAIGEAVIDDSGLADGVNIDLAERIAETESLPSTTDIDIDKAEAAFDIDKAEADFDKMVAEETATKFDIDKAEADFDKMVAEERASKAAPEAAEAAPEATEAAPKAAPETEPEAAPVVDKPKLDSPIAVLNDFGTVEEVSVFNDILSKFKDACK